MMQKKKHLLLLNRIMRAELKKDIIPTPSKLTEEEVNQYFNKLFVKKDEYYVPIKTKANIMIDEEPFKTILMKKPKMKKDKDMNEKKEKEKEMTKSISLGSYNRFVKEFVEPYVKKKKANENASKEENMMIDKYIKLGSNVKKLVEEKLPNIWKRLLNPAFLEREKRKEGLVEEEMKLKDEIKKEDKKKTEPENQLKEPPIEIKPIEKKESHYLEDIKLRPLNNLRDILKINIDDYKYIPLDELNDIYNGKVPGLWYELDIPNRKKIKEIIEDYRFLNDKKNRREQEIIEENKKQDRLRREIENLNKKEVVEELINQPEEIIKRGDYEYDYNYFNSFEMIEKSDRGIRGNEEKLKIKTMLERLQFQYDLYTTPLHCIDTIFNNILNDKDLHKEKINILEPSAGTGRFIRYIIDNKAKIKIDNLDAVEYSPDLYNLLKDKVKIDKIYNGDFLYFKGDKLYNLIIMNPPYRGTVSGINEPEYYKYHLIKAMILKNNSKTIYLISPNLSGSSIENIGDSINLNLNNALLKRVNKFFNFDFIKDMPQYKINKIGECKDFIKFTKSGTTKMQQVFNIYKINI